MDTEAQTARQRKSLAVDQKTYDLLQEICFEERRTRIEQLKILIEQEHKRIFSKWIFLSRKEFHPQAIAHRLRLLKSFSYSAS